MRRLQADSHVNSTAGVRTPSLLVGPVLALLLRLPWADRPLTWVSQTLRRLNPEDGLGLVGGLLGPGGRVMQADADNPEPGLNLQSYKDPKHPQNPASP